MNWKVAVTPLTSDAGAAGTLPGIQYLRGIAAAMVVACHALAASVSSPTADEVTRHLATAGAAGVDIFFVISGFVMFHSMAGRPDPNIPQFFLRRLIRIFPLYWVVLGAIFLMIVIGYRPEAIETAYDYLPAILLWPVDSPLLIVSWTLSYELYFYLVFGLSLLLPGRWLRLIGACCVFLLAAITERLVTAEDLGFLQKGVVLEFVGGMMLAAFHARRPGGDWPRWPWMLVGFAAIVAAPFLFPYEWTGSPEPRWLLWGLPAALIVAAGLSLKPAQGLVARLGLLLGDASYAIYLSHWFVLFVYSKALKETALGQWPEPPLILAAFITSMISGVLFHLWVERPLTRWSKRFAHLQPSPGQASL